MSNFDRAFDALIVSEGGYANNPKDPGGETNWGVTKRVAQSVGYTGNMRDMTRAQAKEVYRALYWHKQLDGLPYAVSFSVFDASVNHGTVPAIKMLQKAVGVLQDGKFGQATAAAAMAVDPMRILALMSAYRIDLYTGLDTFKEFGKGWTRRISHNIKECTK